MLDCRLTHLPGGLRVATAAMPHAESVTVGIWTGVGGRYESSREAGAAHFLEHMAFKGTRSRSARQISESIEGVGGYLNASTGEENTSYFARAHPKHLARLADVLLDMFLNASLAPAEIARERDVIRDEIHMILDQPASQVEDLLNDALWPGHPLGRPITGTLESVSRLSRRSLLAFRGRHYRAANTVIAAAGRLEHDAFVRLVSDKVRGWGRGRPPRCLAARSRQSAPRLRLMTKETEQAHLAIGIRAFSRHDPRRFALRLLSIILGENMSSRLFQELRERRGLAYAVSSSTSHLDDDGLLHIAAGLESGRVTASFRVIVRELRRLRLSPPGPAELRRAKEYATGTLLMGLESSSSQMHWVGECLLAYGRILQPEEILRDIEGVQPSDIRTLARALFVPARLSVALISPEAPRHDLLAEIARLD